MFGRKRRGPTNPSFNDGLNANANAQTAAAQAFLKNQASGASLAAAAAGAALRSRPTTPISVADVQTKRTMRRTTSNSSAGSSNLGSVNGRPSQLERKGSSGSMSERTFRDQSPNRGPSKLSLDDAPPVPPIPSNIKPVMPKNAHKRTASLEAPMRVSSPTPQANGRGSSLQPFRNTQGNSRMSQQRISGLPNVSELTSLERPASRGSVNFSYPTSERAMSPYGSRRLTSPTPSSASQRPNSQNGQLVYDPNTRSFRPESELLFYKQAIQNAAEHPVKKKKRVAPQGAAGTHLSDGTVGGRPKGTAVIAMEQSKSEPPTLAAPPPAPQLSVGESVPATTRRKKKVTMSDSDISAASDNDSDVSEQNQRFNTRAGMMLAKKPSVIRERADEEEEEDSNRLQGRQAALLRLDPSSPVDRTASPLPQSGARRGHGQAVSTTTSTDPANILQVTRAVSQPPLSLSTASTLVEPSDSGDTGLNGSRVGSMRGNRLSSISPARTAHFMSTPESNNLSVKHNPPARSISPRKSALKQSPSPRGPSPISDSPTHTRTHGPTASEISDTSAAMSEDRPVVTLQPRKKAVRVSFDDESNVVLGEAASPVVTDSPIIMSPQNKKTWFSSMGRSKKKDPSAAEEDDEVMKPRPALPSFGSVREKKFRDAEERPLVKPAEPVEKEKLIEKAVEKPISPLFTTHNGEPIEFPLGQSSDHAVGSVLAQDQASKNIANISKSREPLPPEVTSVEGGGYISDSGSSIFDADYPNVPLSQALAVGSVPAASHSKTEGVRTVDNLNHIPPLSVVEDSMPSSIADDEKPDSMTEKFRPELMTEGNKLDSAKDIPNGQPPKLAFTQATPTLEQNEKMEDWLAMPGDFPDTSSEAEDGGPAPGFAEHHATDPTPAEAGIAEPEPIQHLAGSPLIGGIAAQNLHHEPLFEETDESDVYSDAAEDLSDMEGDGFMSLDAVVASPVAPPSPTIAHNSTSFESPSIRAANDRALKKVMLSRKSSEPDLDEGWEKAQQYWSGLTADKKKELEQEAQRQNRDLSSSEDETETEHMKTIPKTKRNVAAVAPPVQPIVKAKDLLHNTDRTYQIAPGAKAGRDGFTTTIRTSMRAPSTNTSDDVHMRKSMRDSNAGKLRGEAREHQESKGSLQKKNRPISYSTAGNADPAAAQRHTNGISTGVVASKKTVRSTAPTLQRTGSDASDSSFKRARPSGDGYSMRNSMRGSGSVSLHGRPQSPSAASQNQNRSSRFSLRSLSPSGSMYRKPFNREAAPPVSLGRASMRTRANSDDSTHFGTSERGKSPRRGFGFGRSKAEPKAKVAAPKQSSRFADSSDEDDARPMFSSRFRDSSDDEAGVTSQTNRRPMTSLRAQATRATPKRVAANEDDSSDLSDSDDEKKAVKKNSKANPILGATSSSANTYQGNALASGSLRRSGSGRDFIGARPNATTVTSITGMSSTNLRPEQKRRGSFMSILRRKKTDPASKVHKADAESAARRDTPLERSRLERDVLKRQDSNFSVGGTPSPKLQKRDTRQSSLTTAQFTSARDQINGDGNSINWPLSKDEEKGRPFTSDGVGIGAGTSELLNSSLRPNVGERRVTATGLAAVDVGDGYGAGLKKKKKFGRLRKVFGLDL